VSPRCLILTSEFPPAAIGGIGRYVAEIAPRLNRTMALRIALVPTYQAPAAVPSLSGADAKANAEVEAEADAEADAEVEQVRSDEFDAATRHYRAALLAVDGAYRTDALVAAAHRVAAACAPGPGAPGAALVVYVQDYALAPIAAALRQRYAHARVIAACHLPVYAGFTYFDKPVSDALHQILEAQLVRVAQRVVVPSAFAGHVLRMVHNLPAAKLAVVALGAHRPTPPVTAPDGPLRLLAVGRPTEQKGYHFLFEAFARLLRTHADARLTVVTGMAANARLEQLATRHGVAAHIDFASPRGHDAIWDEYDRHHLLVTTSLYETFGLAVLEAMASARPALGFAVGALPALWGEALGAELGTPVACVDTLVDRLQRLGADVPYRAAVGERAAARVREFTWERHVGHLAALITVPAETAALDARSWH